MRKRGNQKYMFMFGVFTCLLCMMIVGYAAFSTNLNINVKGNVKESSASQLLKRKVVTSGDGLYKDTYEEGRYVYRGANPDNYITFNNETWRIISIENDNTIKIIRNESIGNMAFDASNTRDSSIDTYCNDNDQGCNAWAATAKLVGNPAVFTSYHPNGNDLTDTTTLTGTVTKDSSLNTYLNETYFNSLSDKGNVVDGNFNVGNTGNHLDEEEWSINIKQEKSYVWRGKVGLMTISEYVSGSIGSTNCKTYKEGYDQNSDCSKNNWLYLGSWEWTISPNTGFADTISVCDIRANGSITDSTTNTNHQVRPVVFLDSNIKLDGSGTEMDPYTIK